jgi:hypothetical protein
MKHICTRYKDGAKELRNKEHVVYGKPRRTVTVDEEVEGADGIIEIETRAWNNVRDGPILSARLVQWHKDQEALRQARGEIWTILISNCSKTILNAVIGEEEYDQIELDVDSLGLFLLMERVCIRENRCNSEAERTKWQHLQYDDGADIWEFFNLFEEIVANIRSAAGAASVKDTDCSYRLREALPKELAMECMKDTYLLAVDDPLYPPYATNKSRVTTFVSSKLRREEEENEVSSAKALLFQRDGKKTPVGKKPYVKRDAKKTTRTMKCYNCNSPDHKKADCPEPPKPDCTHCGMSNHTADKCRFDVKNANCFTNVKRKAEDEAKRKRDGPSDTKYPKSSRPSKSGKAYKVQGDRDEERVDDQSEAASESQSDISDIEIEGNYISRRGRAYMATAHTCLHCTNSDSDNDSDSDSLTTVSRAHTAQSLSAEPTAALLQLDCTEHRLVDTVPGTSDAQLNVDAVELHRDIELVAAQLSVEAVAAYMSDTIHVDVEHNGHAYTLRANTEDSDNDPIDSDPENLNEEMEEDNRMSQAELDQELANWKSDGMQYMIRDSEPYHSDPEYHYLPSDYSDTNPHFGIRVAPDGTHTRFLDPHRESWSITRNHPPLANPPPVAEDHYADHMIARVAARVAASCITVSEAPITEAAAPNTDTVVQEQDIESDTSETEYTYIPADLTTDPPTFAVRVAPDGTRLMLIPPDMVNTSDPWSIIPPSFDCYPAWGQPPHARTAASHGRRVSSSPHHRPPKLPTQSLG